jgi:aspartate aminotransferase
MESPSARPYSALLLMRIQVHSEISARLSGLPDSVTMAITARAAAMRAAGEPVIGFGAGEPDFPTPPHIVASAQQAAADPRDHRYSPAGGLPELRDAVAEFTTAGSGVPVAADQVTITTGAKGAVFGAMAALLDPGDEVLLPAPYWVSYPPAASLFGASVRVLTTTAADRFKVTPDRLEAARSKRTKMLVFCSPGNPTGVVYAPDEVAAIGEWAARHGVWVLSDDIYRSLVYGSEPFVSMAAVAPGVADRFVVVDGVSKAFAMTGWRVGWLIAPPAVARAVSRLQAHSTSNVSNVSQRAALAAVTGPGDATDDMRTAFDRRRQVMFDMLSAVDGVTCVEPDGAFYAFPDVTGLLGRPIGDRRPATAMEMAEALLEEARIAVVPGEAFGAPGHLRFSFAVGDDDLVEGLERFQAVFE